MSRSRGPALEDWLKVADLPSTPSGVCGWVKSLAASPLLGFVIEKLCEARVHACLQMRRRGRRREMRRQSRGRS
jgi:hypothetical protein